MKNVIALKKQLIAHCIQYIEQKHTVLSQSINDANSSLHSASNSTAGDKHDTSRAMMHLEIEKKSKQLNEIEQLKKIIPILNNQINGNTFGIGTIVSTNQGVFFISFNAGKKIIDNIEYTFISLASPLAKTFQQQKEKDSFTFMHKNYTVLSVL